jgi:hypothetical protein
MKVNTVLRIIELRLRTIPPSTHLNIREHSENNYIDKVTLSLYLQLKKNLHILNITYTIMIMQALIQHE